MPKRTNGRAPKDRGDRYEREVAAFFNEGVFEDERVQRAPLSGGGKVAFGKGGMDLLGLWGLFPELKRTNRFSPYAAMKQAMENKHASHAPEAPVVISRRDQMPTEDSLVVMKLGDWTELYASWLRENGVKGLKEGNQDVTGR